MDSRTRAAAGDTMARRCGILRPMTGLSVRTRRHDVSIPRRRSRGQGRRARACPDQRRTLSRPTWPATDPGSDSPRWATRDVGLYTGGGARVHHGLIRGWWPDPPAGCTARWY